MNPRHLLKMAKWAHRPPSTKRVIFVFSIIGICLVLFGIEYFIGLPDWMSAEWVRRPKF